MYLLYFKQSCTKNKLGRKLTAGSCWCNLGLLQSTEILITWRMTPSLPEVLPYVSISPSFHAGNLTDILTPFSPWVPVCHFPFCSCVNAEHPLNKRNTDLVSWCLLFYWGLLLAEAMNVLSRVGFCYGQILVESLPY